MKKPNRWWIALPVTMLAAALIACLGSPASTPAPTSAPTTAPATTAPATAVPTLVEVTEVVGSTDDAKAELVRALQAHLTSGPYRVTSTIMVGTLTIAMHGEVILPDKFHLISSTGGAPEREMLIVGSATYVKVGDNWVQEPIDVNSVISGFVNSLDPDHMSNVVRVGTEDVNGQPAVAYTFTYNNTINGTDVTTNDETWVSVDSGLPIKQIVDGTQPDKVYHTEQYIEHDPSITIEAPAT